MIRLRLVWYSPREARRRHEPTSSPADTLHRLYAERIWQSPERYMRVAAALCLILWPLLFAILSLRYSPKHAPGVKTKFGKGYLRQINEQFEIVRRAGILPYHYYEYGMFDDGLRRHADAYIVTHEVKTVLYPLLKRRLSQERRELLDRKDRFAAACLACNIASIPIIAVIDNSRFDPERADAVALPPCDLFVKPARGLGGNGVEIWRHNPGLAAWHDDRGQLLSRERLLHHLRRRARRGALLVQPVLRMHPEIADLTPGAFITVRVVSQIDEQGHVEITVAVIRLPRDAAARVDNVAQGGLTAEVDLRTGRLGPAADHRNAAFWYDRHPATTAPVAGRILPQWPQACTLVRQAHFRLVPEREIVGWDIGFTETGPCIVEANLNGELTFLQRAIRRPLGNERLGQLFALHVGRAARGEPVQWATTEEARS